VINNYRVWDAALAPISLDLATALAGHASHRDAVKPTDTLLRYRNGGPLTSRRHLHKADLSAVAGALTAMTGQPTRWRMQRR